MSLDDVARQLDSSLAMSHEEVRMRYGSLAKSVPSDPRFYDIGAPPSKSVWTLRRCGFYPEVRKAWKKVDMAKFERGKGGRPEWRVRREWRIRHGWSVPPLPTPRLED